MKKTFDEIRENLPVTGDTVADIMRRPVVLPDANMNHCFVVAEDYKLLGMVSLRVLLMTRGGVRLKDVMTPPFVTLQPEDDQELAAQLMQEYDLLELPVVDEKTAWRASLPPTMPWPFCGMRPRRIWR